MNELGNVSSTQFYKVDPDQLKRVVMIMKKCATDLKNIKNKADSTWNDCKSTMDSKYLRNLDETKRINNKKFRKAIEDLENYADVLSTVANIYKETEGEIISSSNELDELIGKINNNLIKSFGLKTFMFDNYK